MKHKTGKLYPFKNAVFSVFEHHLLNTKIRPTEAYKITEDVLFYLHYLQAKDLKINLKSETRKEDYLNYLIESKVLKLKDLERIKKNLEIFYQFLEKYI
jgi:hypothetical protein